MKIKNIILIFFILPVIAFANTGDNKRVIKWEAIQKVKIAENQILNILYFDNAIYYDQISSLPVFTERFPLSSANDKLHVILKNKVFEEFDENIIKKINDIENIPDSIIINTSLVIEKKTPYALISFVPIRKNLTSGKYEKLISFDIDFKITGKSEKQTYRRTYVENSVLSTGDWYRIKVTNKGIHKITYSDMVEMGIDVDNIDPRNIRIYGNGNGMVPERNMQPRHDDLLENAIEVVGEEDGSFDQNDYILFYGESAITWKFNVFKQIFEHKVNLYSDHTCYFISTSLGEGKRISFTSSSGLEPTNFVSKFHDYDLHENDYVNLLKSGKEWFGESFENDFFYDFPFEFPNIDSGYDVQMKFSYVVRSEEKSNFTVYANNNEIACIELPAFNTGGSTYALSIDKNIIFNQNQPDLNITIKYDSPSPTSITWLDFLELNLKRHLIFNGEQLAFRELSSIGEGNITEFNLSNANPDIKIWDVTDKFNIKQIEAEITGTNLYFTVPTDSLREFLAWDNFSFFSAEFIEKVDNQNLHGLEPIDMVIVTNPLFISQAYELANLHQSKDNLSVYIVTIQQIYNEFSSGVQDISAIRDFIKVLYDKAGPTQIPKYLLLFGDGSYDPKDRIPANNNFVPTFQSKESLRCTISYVTDDFFGLLDYNEGYDAGGTVDIGIGRFPVQSIEQAENAINKVKNYVSKNDSTYADWRNLICFVADDEDNNLHFRQAEKLASIVDTSYKTYNLKKIYLDAYPQISTPGGKRYPDVNQEIYETVKKGALIINYTGHGGELGWSSETVLDITTINSWNNKYNLPVFFTATCAFSRFDNPELTSAGELVFLNPDGGGIALFTTTRVSYAQSNFNLNKKFYQNAFELIDGEYPKLGDLVRISKTPSNINAKNFVLLGDPALQIAYPHYNVSTTSINTREIKSPSDTLMAMSKISISGMVHDVYGNKCSDFNGYIFPKILDKPVKNSTLGNDAHSQPNVFYTQNNIIYKGKYSVINGEFSFSFVVPKDISYNFGLGKISYYARDTINYVDANGFEEITIGGIDENATPDFAGPEIELYLNDKNFVSGGITNESPLLLAYISDQQGINYFSNGIGHDIVAVLDDDYCHSIVLNDYYEPCIDSYQKGEIKYLLSDLDDGLHTLQLKAWDVYNNSSEARIEFIVNKSAKLALNNVLNYPNPFSTGTWFTFKHNKPGEQLDIQIQIFTIEGKLLKTLTQKSDSDGINIEPVYWNGLDDNGSRVDSGFYIYKLLVKENENIITEQSQKLVIIR